MPERLAYMGGTFDPVHNGHLSIARAVAQRLSVDRVTFVPAAAPPHKSGGTVAGKEDRLAMLELAVGDQPLLAVSRIELDRPGPSYTRDTLVELRRLAGPGPELVWIIGADMLADLHLWHRADEVVDLATIVTAVRSPWDRRLEQIFQRLSGSFTIEQVARLRQGVLSTPLADVSSTLVRARVSAGQSVAELVPPAVSDYIAAHGLYRRAH
ncbi:MAG: nicotinate-nucleotide adenylyltransferase [Planctomycetaceae bacterium]|nr:nicotinate-nucleotide adenylyltransferase [Planctomycetaceae bacterium]